MLAQDGEVIGGRYTIKRILGMGGFAEVYQGVDQVLDRDVAIKILNFTAKKTPGVSAQQVAQDTLERFRKEARILANLKDPATITLFDFGSQDDGKLYMVLELIEGNTLHDILNAQGPLDVYSAVRVLVQTLESLREAHLFGLLHRDIKPANIMIFRHVDDPWRVRLLDFGIAKAIEENASAMTAAGILTGTVRYVPPERLLKQPLSAASDLYSLGCVMYFTLTGQEIYRDANSTVALIQAQRNPQSVELPEHLDIPIPLREVVNKLLTKDTSRRYATAQQVIDDLELLGVELQIARHGLGLEDLKAAVARTQALPAIGLGLDESSAATIQMDASEIPGIAPPPQPSYQTIPVSMDELQSQDVHAHIARVQPGFTPRTHDPRLSTAPQPLLTGPQLAPPTQQPAHQETPAPPPPNGLTRQHKIIIGVGIAGLLFLVIAVIIIAVVVFVSKA